MTVDPSLLEKDLAAIRKRRGEVGTRMGHEAVDIERIPLESPTLMRITTGGIPIGRIARFFGARSSGKTNLAFLVMAAAQKYRSERFPDGLGCAYWNVEGIWDAKHSARLGIDTTKVVLKDTKIIEEIAVDLELLLRSVHLHVIDSTSDAKCVDELAAEAEDWLPMLQAKAWKRAMNRIEARFDGDENVLILISHLGQRVDMKRRTSYTFPKDGEHLEYVSSLNIELTAGSWLFYHPDAGHLEKDEKIKGETGIGYAGVKEPDGIEVTVKCRKNRVGRQHLSGKMRFDLNSFAYDTVFELADAATYFDVSGVPAHRSKNPPIAASKGGGWYDLPDFGVKAHGVVGLRDCIVKDRELASVIRRAMLSGW